MAGENILIVEDNASNLQLAEFVLRAAGFKVTSATSGTEGVEKARSGAPDLILMDVEMAGMDGLTATRLIKSEPALAHIPVVALTAYAMSGDKERCLAAGCTGYITKPINTKQLAQSVSEYLRNQKA